MKKVLLSVVGFSLLCRLNSMAQTQPDTTFTKPKPSLYTPIEQEQADYAARALRLEEVNFVTSYYNQSGDHSAVTGGVGTEQVTDFSNGLDLKFSWYGPGMRKNSLTAGLGIDYHSSASAAFVNQSGASKTGGTRVYPSLDWSMEGHNGSGFGIGTYLSTEYNYQSFGTDVHFSAKTPDKNGEFSVKLQGYFDAVTMIYPSELVPGNKVTTKGTVTYITTASGRTVASGGSGGSSESSSLPTSGRNTYSASMSYSQMINSRLQISLLADVVNQKGYLGLPFHRVYLKEPNSTTLKDTVENLPSNRFKLPIGARLNYFLGDNLIIRSYYRYYTDDWATKSHTANLELTYKITPFFSVSPFYRFYTQTAAKYFAAKGEGELGQTYYTSNYEYAAFNSMFFGAGIRMAPPTGVFGWQGLHDLEIRYGHYSQTTGLSSDVVSLNFGFK